MMPEQLPIPDEMPQDEREAISIETRDRTAFHLKAIKWALIEAGVEPNAAELTRFGAQIYMDGFRGAIFKRTVAQMQRDQNQLPLPFDPNATSH